jgi:transposase
LAHPKVRATLDCEIAALEEHLTERLAQREDVCLLQTVPGSAAFLPRRSRWKWETSAGLPMPDVSPPIADWSQAANFQWQCQGSRAVAKCGNRYLAWAFMEAALFAKRWSPQAQSFYRRRSSKRHKLIALKALAHKYQL